MKRGFTFTLSLCLMSCAPAPRVVGQEYFAQAVSFCEMMANPDKYVDREVLVSGLYIMTPHRGEIYGPGCEGNSIALRADVDLPQDQRRVRAVIEAAQKHISGARVPIVAKGLLRKYRGSGITTSWDEFWLERAQIVAANGALVQHPPD